jgi:hypothetical protein
MAIRTVQILGQGYGANPAEITVTANGNTIFLGTVATVDQPLPALPNLEIDLTNILCTFEIDTAFAGEIPMTYAVSAGTVIFADIYANYISIPNPVYTTAQLETLQDPATSWQDHVAIYIQVAVPPMSQAEIDVLLDKEIPISEKNAIVAAHNCTGSISSGADGYGLIDQTDSRSSVVIDGVAQTPNYSELPGPWWWTVNTGSTMTCQFTVDPATV